MIFAINPNMLFTPGWKQFIFTFEFKDGEEIIIRTERAYIYL